MHYCLHKGLEGLPVGVSGFLFEYLVLLPFIKNGDWQRRDLILVAKRHP